MNDAMHLCVAVVNKINLKILKFVTDKNNIYHLVVSFPNEIKMNGVIFCFG